MKKIIVIASILALAITVYFVLVYARNPQSDQTRSGAKQYSMNEIALHNGETDCWIAVEGKVYDVTSFISDHPGGEAILQGCGKDATSMFNRRPGKNSPHSQSARELLTQYYLGDLE